MARTSASIVAFVFVAGARQAAGDRGGVCGGAELLGLRSQAQRGDSTSLSSEKSAQYYTARHSAQQINLAFIIKGNFLPVFYRQKSLFCCNFLVSILSKEKI